MIYCLLKVSEQTRSEEDNFRLSRLHNNDTSLVYKQGMYDICFQENIYKVTMVNVNVRADKNTCHGHRRRS